MRNPQEDRKDALLESLELCGLSAQQLEAAEKYVNGETKTCDLGITALSGYLSGAKDADREQKIEKCIERLERHKETETCKRYLEVLFQIFGVSMVSAYNRAYQSRMLLPAKIRVAFDAGAQGWGRGLYCRFKNLLKITENREDLKAAMEYTEKSAGGQDYAILTAMFYDGPQNKIWDGKPVGGEAKQAEKGVLGFLNGLFGIVNTGEGSSGFETNSYVTKYPKEFARYQEMFPEILDLTFNTAIPGGVKQAMCDFLKEKNVRKPIPAEILSFTSNGSVALMNERAGALISHAAATYRLSPVIFQYLRICLSGRLQRQAMEYMYAAEYKNGMDQEIKRWRVDFGLDDLMLIQWLAGRRQGTYMSAPAPTTIAGKLLGFMTKVAPDAYLQAIRSADLNSYQVLLDAAKSSGNFAFIQGKLQPMMGSEKSSIQQKIIAQIVPQDDASLRADSTDYLTGVKGIEAVLPWEAKLNGYSNYQNLSGAVLNYAATFGTDAFYDRALAYLGLRLLTYTTECLCKDKNHNFVPDLMKAMYDSMERGGLPVLQRLKVAALLLDAYAGKREVKQKELEKYFAKVLSAKREETLAAFLNAPVSARILGIAILNKDAVANKPELLKYAGDSSKQAKEELVKIYSAHEDWMDDFLQMLKTSKKSAEREMAAMVLAKYKKISSHKEELAAVLEQEKSKKVIDLLREILRTEGTGGTGFQGHSEGADAGAAPQILTADAYVKECHKGGRKKSLAWLYDQPMPEVHFCDAEPALASEEYLQAILLSYSGSSAAGLSKDVHILTDGLNPSELATYMEAVYEKFIATGAEAKKRWVLYCTSIHGGARMVPKLQHQINEWAENSRGAMAADAVRALALNDSPTALLVVDGMARKYKHKQVRKAAQDAMTFAAEQLGLSVEELADRIVPDLGFDERMERHFDYGTRSFTVRISPSLDVEVKDESGKKLKSLPAVGKNDDEAKATAALEEFKELKKQMKTTVKTQALRLELAMSLDRKWTAENWKRLFVKNPLMHQFAISLIWGDYRDGKLETTFRYLEDGTFNTVDEEEYELPEEGKIGLVHPIELDKETIDAWKEQLSDYEITQSVEQLDRPVYQPTEEELGSNKLERFGGKILNGLSLSGKLTGLGWNKGMPEDAGIYYSFWRKDVEAGYGVELRFSGAYAGDENDEVTVFDAGIYTVEDFEKCCTGYSHGKNKEQKQLMLRQISPRYLSEILYQLTKATASSTETDANWRKAK